MRIFFLPGIGGTQALFDDYQFSFPTHRLDHLNPGSMETSFRAYAEKMVETYGIRDGDVLVGMSLGGMISCEIAKFLSIPKLILISSCTSSSHINPLMRSSAFLAPHVPFQTLQRIPDNLPLRPARRRMIRMFKQSDPLFLNWSCYHAAHWDGFAGHDDLTQIHGTWDPIFPFRLQRQRIHHVIPRADHIAVLSHSDFIHPILLQALNPVADQAVA